MKNNVAWFHLVFDAGDDSDDAVENEHNDKGSATANTDGYDGKSQIIFYL